MAQYHVLGRHLDGSEWRGDIRAEGTAELEAALLNRGIFIEDTVRSFDWWQKLLLQLLKRAEITRLTRQIGLLLESELPIIEVLALVRDQTGDRVVQDVLSDISGQVERGKPVAESFARYPALFDTLYISMLQAGESSGDLDRVFEQVADYREKREAVMGKVRSAMAYPLLVVTVAFVVVTALILYVVPVFASMYDNFGAELPALTQSVVGLSDNLRAYAGYWICGLAVLIGLGTTASLSDRARLWTHRLVFSIPSVGRLTRRVITARFCATMGSLLQSGVDIITAVGISSQTTGNMYVERRLRPVQDLLAQGKSFTESLASSAVLPKAVLRLTASGEKAGRLAHMLLRAAKYYERETEIQLSMLTSLMEPVIIIVLGGIIAFVLVAMYLPLFDLVGAVN